MIAKIRSVLLLIACSGLTAFGQTINHWETAVFKTDTWRYFIGTSDPGQDWKSLSFDDNLWPVGPGGFGYGDNDDNTEIPQCISVFLRIKFNITDTSLIRSAVLNIDYDDGFTAYLNNKEIARTGLTGINPSFDQLAVDHEARMYSGGEPESFLLSREDLEKILLNGDNILAVELCNFK
jgi:hypothetical protein